MFDLIIIGGGPAGLTATVYALRKRLNVLLITKDLGGKTNFRLQLPDVEHHLVINGEEVVNRFVNEIEYLDFSRVMDKVEKIQKAPGGHSVRVKSGTEYLAKALVIATGANARRLNVPGEKEYMMRGLCYSAVSYAPLFIERNTAVVGDAGLALRSAAELAQIAKRVTLVAPTHGELDSALGKRLLASSNVVVLEGYQVQRVNGDDYARSLVVKKNGDTREIAADAIFIELGLDANSDVVGGLAERDLEGRIKIDARNRTSAPGIFAAGDVTDAFAEQVLISIGEGAKAALSAYEYLLGQPVEEPVAAGEWR
ncbi:MAG: FAD-dependent oxidoreductase [Chloroflexi bacterium]|nr:FAD-dependent oxidoreductase [Chloroflexota bacterium]